MSPHSVDDLLPNIQPVIQELDPSHHTQLESGAQVSQEVLLAQADKLVTARKQHTVRNAISSLRSVVVILNGISEVVDSANFHINVHACGCLGDCWVIAFGSGVVIAWLHYAALKMSFNSKNPYGNVD